MRDGYEVHLVPLADVVHGEISYYHSEDMPDCEAIHWGNADGLIGSPVHAVVWGGSVIVGSGSGEAACFMIKRNVGYEGCSGKDDYQADSCCGVVGKVDR